MPKRKDKAPGRDLKPLMLSNKHNWLTPPDFFNPIRDAFNIQLDPCTTADNPLGTKYFITAESNSLTKDWLFNAFCNPPFNMVKEFTSKCMRESAHQKITVVEIMANRTETAAVQTYGPYAKAFCLINKRISFIDPDKAEQKMSPTFGSMLLIFKPDPLTIAQLEVLQSFGLTLSHYKL